MLNAAMLLAAQKIVGQSFHGGLSTPINLRPFTNHQVNKETFSFLIKEFDQKASRAYGDKLNNYCSDTNPETGFQAIYQIDRHKQDFLHYHHPDFH